MEPKVLFTASTYSHIANFHRPYLQAFSCLGWTVDVACGGAPRDIPEARRILHLPFEKSITAPSNFRAERLLREEMRRERYTLVSAHTSLAAFFTRLAARGLDTTVVNTCHGYLFDPDAPSLKGRLLLEAERLTAHRTDLLLTMNRRDQEIARRYRLGRQILPIPGMGVDFSPLDSLPSSAGTLLRGELEIPEEAFVLLYPAEFSARKNQAMLLRALALLPPDVYLLLPGNGALLDRCRALAAELGVQDRVRFPGQVSDMGCWYQAADCAVSSSRSEGLPFNIMEAMHCSLPVAASAIKGHEDLVTPGETGFLFPSDDEETCAAQIDRLRSSPELAARLGGQARDASQPYSLEAVLPQVMAAYGAVVPALANAGLSLSGK
ncbi:MAG: glycosyltransferase [Oscillospiraceae bacterium]|nr:glycosyltransferase [Oscillospiraceae bacterium]